MAESPRASGWDAHVHVFSAGEAARAGHYSPGEHSLEQAQAAGQPHGIGHLVLVQPSVYGSDNSLLVRALRAQPGRNRGVAVLDADTSDAQLAELDAAGVRAVRFNLVSPVGNDAQSLDRLAPRLRALGWHVQWYVHAADLPALVTVQRRHGLVFVLDHLAGMRVDQPATDEQWAALRELGQTGAWLKLSGWYRLGATEPYAGLAAHIARCADPFGDRLVWGSDWPHTSLPAQARSRHASLLAPAQQALGQQRLHAALHRHPGLLYA